MRAEVKTLLTKLGVSAETIADLAAEDKQVKVDEIFASVKTSFEDRLKNDDAFLTPIKASVRGEVLSSKERKLMKQFGVTQEEYDALPQSTKFDSLIDLCGTKAKPSGTPEDVKAEIEKLRGKLVEKDERIKTLTEVEIPQIKSAVDRERAEAQKTIQMQRALKTVLGERKLIVSEDAAFAVINSEAAAKYDIKYEGGALKVYNKGSETEAFDDNTNKRVTVEGLFGSTLEAHKLVVKSNAGGDPPATPPATPPAPANQRVIHPPGVQKALQRAEELKAQGK
jgi:hypothetical protein